jgi:diguanylate cyclase (GGDEF)-like protein
MLWLQFAAFFVSGVAVGLGAAWWVRRRSAGSDDEDNPPVIDSLMGIFDARFLQRRLSEEVSRAGRYGQPLSLLVLDVDDFARVNRDHGRRTGDQVLNWLGRLLEDGLREEDVAGRSGGDEMVVVAPCTDLVGATQLANRLRRTIETFEFLSAGHTANHKPLRCSVSVGVAALKEGETRAEQLMEAARAAAGEARRAGGNRVNVRRGEHGHPTSRP